MKRITHIVLIVFFVVIALSLSTLAQGQDGCTRPLIAGKENLIPEDYTGDVEDYPGAGSVSADLSEDGNTLTVVFTTQEGWELLETHLYVGNNEPDKSAPGRFPYKHDPVENPDTDTYEISLIESGISLDGSIFFAAHAAMQFTNSDGEIVEETAWAYGKKIPDRSRNWAMYFECTSATGQN
ncbi:MAG: hypothetical protein ACMUIL_11675 [bacterium]